MKINEQIKQIMVDKGISGYKICKDTGVNQSHFSKFLRGEVLLLEDKIKEVCKYLGVEYVPAHIGRTDGLNDSLLHG